MEKTLLKVKKELLIFEMENLNQTYDEYLPEETKIYADSLEEAIDIASKEMNMSPYSLEYEIIQKGFIDFWNFRRVPYIVYFYTNQNLSQGVDLVQRLKESIISSYLGQFKVKIYTEGVFLKCSPEKNKHRKVRTQFICDKLDTMGVNGYLYNDVKEVSLEERNISVKIAEWKPNPNYVDSKIQVKISDDQMKAFIYIVPPQNGGRHLTKEQILKIIKQQNVHYGVQEDEIEYCLLNEIYHEYHEVALGFDPNAEYQNAYIQYNINNQKKVKFSASTREALFWDTSIIENVKKGQLLAQIIIPEVKNYRMLVIGRKVPIENVLTVQKNIALKGGKGTESSLDKQILRAKYDGRVVMYYGKLYIEDIYYVHSNLKADRGTLHFRGTIIVKGNVLEKNNVNAEDAIYVKGNTYKANLTGKNDITLVKGISANIDNFVHSREGSIYTQFVQTTSLYAKKDIIVGESVVNSYLYAENAIRCIEGRKSQIFGGSTFIGNSLVVNNLGNKANTKTNVIVGCNVSNYFLLNKVNGLLKKTNNTLSENIKEKALLEQQLEKKWSSFSENEQITYTHITERIEVLKSKIDALEVKKSGITLRLYTNKANLTGKNALVHVSGTIYAGVTVQIQKESFTFEKNMNHITIYLNQEGEIRTKPYTCNDKFTFFVDHLATISY